jgi:hypothetical protein
MSSTKGEKMTQKYCTWTTDAPPETAEMCGKDAVWHIAWRLAAEPNGKRHWTTRCDEHASAVIQVEHIEVVEMHRVGSGCAEGHLKKIAELVHPCPAPDVANGYDLCPVHAGSAWPCDLTKVAWIARGLNVGEQVRAAMADAMSGMDREGQS